jgi:hypothetical protein
VGGQKRCTRTDRRTDRRTHARHANIVLTQNCARLSWAIKLDWHYIHMYGLFREDAVDIMTGSGSSVHPLLLFDNDQHTHVHDWNVSQINTDYYLKFKIDLQVIKITFSSALYPISVIVLPITCITRASPSGLGCIRPDELGRRCDVGNAHVDDWSWIYVCMMDTWGSECEQLISCINIASVTMCLRNIWN